jgi:hypothetical protein
MATGPLMFGYDGSPDCERAMREASTLLTERRAIVVVVIGAQGRNGLLGPTTRSVIHLAPCPVAVRGPGS